jgi:hypothetical protein
MKLVKNVLFSAILVSAMAVWTPAGEQQTPGFTCTNNCQKMTASDSTEETGGIITETSIGTSDYLLFEALAAVLSVY